MLRMDKHKVFKIIIMISILLFFTIGIYRIIKINEQYPQYEKEYYSIGETIRSNGFDFIIKSMEIYSEDELVQAYSLEKFDYVPLEDGRYIYLVHIEIINNSQTEIYPSVMADYYLEGNYRMNGFDHTLFQFLNYDQTKQMPNSKVESGEQKGFVYPYIYHEHFFREDLSELKSTMSVSLSNCQYPIKKIIQLN